MKEFTAQLESSFKSRLVGVIGYGSFFTSPQIAKDIDLVIILDQLQNDDIQTIKESYQMSKLIKPISPLIFYLDNLPNDPAFFSINTCGPFFLDVIKSGKVLSGKNVFLKLGRVSLIDQDMSRLQKLQQYTYQHKTMYINQGTWSDSQKHTAKKRLTFALLGTSFIAGKKYEELLSKNLIDLIKHVTKPDTELTDKDLAKIGNLLDKLWIIASKVCHEKYPSTKA